LIGLLAIAGLTACGDKIEVPGTTTTPPSNVVRSVTVSPASASLNQGDKITLAASVNADAGVTDRTVTWSSSNTAIANVDANGLVTAGTTAGTATITAAAKADPTVKGAALITVASTTPTQGAPATVSISSINTTRCDAFGGCTSVPANLGNVTGQIDVTLNVDPGTARLVGVDLVLNCTGNGNSGQDTVVATQTLASANVAAEASTAPVTLSFNTASFNGTTGATAIRNGQCTIKGRARTNTTPGGAITTTTSTGSALTINNVDVVVGSITSTKTAVRPSTGLVWNGGDVTVTTTPVMYSGRVPATTTITFEGKTITLTGTGTQSATFTDGNGANAGGATDIDGITDPAAAATFSLVDAAGQGFTTNPCGAAAICSSTSVLSGAVVPAAIAAIRLDTQKPLPGTFAVASNADQGTSAGGYVGANFRFAADSAAGYRGPNAVAGNQTLNNDAATGTAGVDAVTVVVQTRTTGASASTYTTRTSTADLAETTTSGSLQLRMITSDALGNADTTTVSTFGVDKTAPTFTAPAGPADQTTVQAVGGAGAFSTTISDNLSGVPASQLVAQTSLNNGITATTTMPAEGTVFTAIAPNTAGPCVVGRFNSTAAAAGPNALTAFARDGTVMGFCTPVSIPTGGSATGIGSNYTGASGYITTRLVTVDVAGNQAVAFTRTVAEDASSPTVTSLDLPGTLTGNSTASVSASVADNMDIVGSSAAVNYATPTGSATAITLQYATTAGPGVAFDNVLTRSATVSPSIPNFIKNLQVNNGSAAVTAPAAGGNATSITVTGVDESGRTGTLTGTLAPAVSLAAGSTAAIATNFSGGFSMTSSATTLSNCPAAGCQAVAGGAVVAASNATAATITVTAVGTTGTFNNPFSGGSVGIWYQVGGAGPWFFAGNAGAGTTRDTGANRFWDYTFSFDPPATTGNGASLTPAAGTSTTIGVMAIGVNSAGDAVATPVTTFTLTNP
jgi:hypothetical protein